MADDENSWKWDEFVEIGNTIHKMRGQHRRDRAQDALTLAAALRNANFLIRSKERYELYKTLHSKIYIHTLMETLNKAGLDDNLFGISFLPKRSGIQTGFICEINDETNKTRYFVKTHQHGPTAENPQSLKPPNTKELFIYKLLQNIGIGPEAHFIIPTHGSTLTIYIATKDCHIRLLSQLTKESANIKALVQLDLISRVLCLRDCASKTSNCGQVANGKPMIIDFRIEKQSGGYAKPDILESFYRGNGEFNYSGLMEHALAQFQQPAKLQIVKESLAEWDLLTNIDKTLAEVTQLLRKIGQKIKFQDDLQRYIDGVKAKIQYLKGLR